MLVLCLLLLVLHLLLLVPYLLLLLVEFAVVVGNFEPPYFSSSKAKSSKLSTVGLCRGVSQIQPLPHVTVLLASSAVGLPISYR